MSGKDGPAGSRVDTEHRLAAYVVPAARRTLVELSDGEVQSLLNPDDENLGFFRATVRSKLLPTREPSDALTLLRLLAEGSDRPGDLAREYLVSIGDRVAPDAPEGSGFDAERDVTGPESRATMPSQPPYGAQGDFGDGTGEPPI